MSWGDPMHKPPWMGCAFALLVILGLPVTLVVAVMAFAEAMGA